MGAEGAKNRQLLVDAAERVLCGEGYAAVTARRVAAEAGLKVPLVYYYFQTMDDLVTALIVRNNEQRMARFEQALASADPLRDLWTMTGDPSGPMTSELLAMANHRESIRAVIVARAKEFRAMQIAAVERLLIERGVDITAFPAAGIVTIANALARAVQQDTAIGFDDGYADAVALIDTGLDFLAREPGEA